MKVMVVYTGQVVWYRSGEFVTSCEINAFYLPFDHQNCPIIVTHLVATAEYNNLTAYDANPKYDKMIPSNEWTLLHANTTEDHIQEADYTLAEVTFTLALKRQSGYYLITIILPTIGLSVVGLMGFLLPPDCGEKISLSVACMMAFFITQMTIAEHLPSSWNRMPVISKYPFKNPKFIKLSCKVSVSVYILRNNLVPCEKLVNGKSYD